MTPRLTIKSVRDYEHFLRARGFSKKEAVLLATAYKLLTKNEAGRRGSQVPQQTLIAK